MAQDPNNLIWIDLEMSGLDPETDRILEVAMVVTDSYLNTVAESPVLVVHQEAALLGAMDDWNKSTHAKSGLIGRVAASTLTEAEVEEQMPRFSRRTSRPRSRRCAATPCTRTGAFCPATCRGWRRSSCTATST